MNTRAAETRRAGAGQQSVAMEAANGSGAAAILAAGIGCFLVAALAIVADKSSTIKSTMNFYKPTGPLSGVTTTAVVIWLVSWFVLEFRWRKHDVVMGRISAIAVGLLVLSVLLTFPPIGDLF
jgi:hypothetical protein